MFFFFRENNLNWLWGKDVFFVNFVEDLFCGEDEVLIIIIFKWKDRWGIFKYNINGE